MCIHNRDRYTVLGDGTALSELHFSAKYVWSDLSGMITLIAEDTTSRKSWVDVIPANIMTETKWCVLYTDLHLRMLSVNILSLKRCIQST